MDAYMEREGESKSGREGRLEGAAVLNFEFQYVIE